MLLVLVNWDRRGVLHHVLRMVGVTQEEEVRIPSDAFTGISSSVLFLVVVGNLYCFGILLSLGKLYLRWFSPSVWIILSTIMICHSACWESSMNLQRVVSCWVGSTCSVVVPVLFQDQFRSIASRIFGQG